MIGAGDAAFLDAAIRQGSPAVSAAVVEQTGFAFRSQEEYQIFAENPDKFGRTLRA
jgi:hypothetical protein